MARAGSLPPCSDEWVSASTRPCHSDLVDETLSSSAAQRLRDAALTYAPVGGTRTGEVPSGFATFSRTRTVGEGQERFEVAARGLLRWEMHRRAGLRVQASHGHVTAGAVAVLRLGVGRVALAAPVRVVHVVDEPRRQGFAYGTLPGHPESGEESFVLELQPGGSVDFTITAFSRPATWLARAAGPVGRRVQSSITDRYLRSV
ncbi:DUF1990 domain-containing protein [Janibacter limosus]|uniref:DUF1990 domain-containing protein n=1 Tax=Janibacter limosus TaxID=53458 RepID=A0A4P6MYK5_9MICO|nr:DUF1990 domain-containing protein [Janibacter limosus]